MKNTRTSQYGAKRTAMNPRPKTEETGGLKRLFINELKDIYWSEKAMKKAMGQLTEHISTGELKDLVQEQANETEQQIVRLEKVFALMELPVEARKCAAIAGLIREIEELVKAHPAGPVRDAGIIFAAQKIGHYEIATYGTLCSFAQTLNEDEVASLLEDSLNEEKQADETLSQIAESMVNAEAMEPEEQDKEQN